MGLRNVAHPNAPGLTGKEFDVVSQELDHIIRTREAANFVAAERDATESATAEPTAEPIAEPTPVAVEPFSAETATASGILEDSVPHARSIPTHKQLEINDSLESTCGYVAEALTNFNECALGAVYPRRSWSLLGQDIVKNLGLIKSEKIELWVDRSSHKLELWSWGEVFNFEKNILACQYLTGTHDSDAAELNMITNDTESLSCDNEVGEEKNVA